MAETLEDIRARNDKAAISISQQLAASRKALESTREEHERRVKEFEREYHALDDERLTIIRTGHEQRVRAANLDAREQELTARARRLEETIRDLNARDEKLVGPEGEQIIRNLLARAESVEQRAREQSARESDLVARERLLRAGEEKHTRKLEQLDLLVKEFFRA